MMLVDYHYNTRFLTRGGGAGGGGGESVSFEADVSFERNWSGGDSKYN